MADFILDSLKGGLNLDDPPSALAKDACTVANNVEFFLSTLGERRKGCEPIVLPAVLVADADMDAVTFMYRHLPTNDEADAELWILGQKMDGSVARLFRNVLGVWTEVDWPTSGADTDTPVSTGLIDMRMQSLHGKLFVAYPSAEDRLHVWDGTEFRRAGLREGVAPTAAEGTAAVYEDIVLGDAPIGYWRCNEAAIDNLADSSGNGHTVFIGSSTPTYYVFGEASPVIDGGLKLRLLGGDANSQNQVSPTFDVMANTPGSFEFWITPNVNTISSAIFRGITDGRANIVRSVGVREATGVYVEILLGTASAVLVTVNSTATLTLGTLYHIVVTFDGSGAGSIFINGALDSTFDASAYHFFRMEGIFNTVISASSFVPFFTTFDEAAVYDSQLTLEQVLNHYNAGT